LQIIRSLHDPGKKQFAVKVLSAGCGPEFDALCRRITAKKGRVVVEWIILLRDIQVRYSRHKATQQLTSAKNSDVKNNFFTACCFVGLHILPDLTNSSAAGLLDRTPEQWAQLLYQKSGLREADPDPDPDVDLGFHKISLLRRLFQCVGGDRDAHQLNFDRTLSASQNLAIIADIFSIHIPSTPLRFARFDDQKVFDALSQCEACKGTELDIAALKRQVLRGDMPIGVSSDFPDFAYDIEWSIVESAIFM